MFPFMWWWQFIDCFNLIWNSLQFTAQFRILIHRVRKSRDGHTFSLQIFTTYFLAYGTRARSARGSQNRAILSIICPFTGNSAFRLCVSIYTVERKRLKSLFAKLTQINTLSIRFCRLLTLDSKIPAWIRLRLVRKSTNKSQSTTAYVRILLADNPSLLTKKLPQNFWPSINSAHVHFKWSIGKEKLSSWYLFRINIPFQVAKICISTTKLLLTIARRNTFEKLQGSRWWILHKNLGP